MSKKTFLKAGTLIVVKPTAPGIRQSYPAADWVKSETIVRLKEDAPNENTLDVLDVEPVDGDDPNLSIYDFNIKESLSK